MSRHTQPTGQNKVAATQKNASPSRPLEQAPALVQEEIVPFEKSAGTLSRALGDHRPHLPLQRVQRQQMVGRIAQHYGNGHLGQLVAIGGGAQAAHRRNEEREMIGYRQESIHAALRPGKDDVETSHNMPDKSVVSVQAARPVVAARPSASAVQRWSLSDFVPDALKKAGRSVAKFAGKAVDSVTDLAQTALHVVAPLARRIPGYSLLSVVLGKDPISDQETPATPSTLVGGIVGLIPGGDKLFENLQTANSLEAAFGWLQAQLAGLNLTWDYVKERFAKAWAALSAADFLAPTRAFAKIEGIFLPLIGRIKQFAIAAGNKIWELAFEGALKLAGPSAGMVLNVIKRAGGAFSAIVKDPIGFLGRLIDGLGQGFQNFGANIGAHLQTGFVGWLTGAMRGVNLQMPDDLFSLEGTFDLVTQVLGITKEYIRAKAVKLLGERTVDVAERVFEPFVVLFNEGPLGLLRFAQEQFSNLKEMVMDQIQELLSNQVVRAGIRWMMALLSPAGALLKAATTIYDIITFMVERANQMVEFVDSVVGSIGAIARGAIGGAAKLIEGALAKSLPVLIGFLANLVGVGGVGEKVLGIFRKVRGKVDAVIEEFVLKVKKIGQKLLAKLGVGGKHAAGKGEAESTPEEQQQGVAAIELEERQYVQDGSVSHENALKTATAVKQKHPVFQSVTVVDGGDSWDYEYVFRAKLDTPNTYKPIAEGKNSVVAITEIEKFEPAGFNNRDAKAFGKVKAEIIAELNGKTIRNAIALLNHKHFPPKEESNIGVEKAVMEYLTTRYSNEIASVSLEPIRDYRPDFRESVKLELAQIYPEFHQEGTTKILTGMAVGKDGTVYNKALFDRRHITAFDLIKSEILAHVEGKSFLEAVLILKNEANQNAEPNIDSIIESVKAYLRHEFNNLVNLFVGDAEENQALGREMAQAKQDMRQASAEGSDNKFREADERYSRAVYDPEPIDYFYDHYRELRTSK